MSIQSPATVTEQPPDLRVRSTPTVTLWATLGAMFLVFIAYLMQRWVTGPFWQEVPVGPTEPPTWMKVGMVFWQIVTIPMALALVYRFVIRPWRHEGRVGVDGLLVMAGLTVWWQDIITSYFGEFVVYNSWMVNRGSWVASIPGWLSYAQPGRMPVIPLWFIFASYVMVVIIAGRYGSWIMRGAKARWPRMSKFELVAVGYVACVLWNFVLEGLIFLPLGIAEYPGGHWNIFPGTYHQYPIHEGLFMGAFYTGIACLRYFTDDRGRTLVERGIDRIGGGEGKKFVVRALAVIGAVQLMMLMLYSLPSAIVVAHPGEWPAAIQERSYLTNGICGDGTDRLCPGPAVPNTRNDPTGRYGGSAYIGTDGQLVVPPGARLPAFVPFVTGTH